MYHLANSRKLKTTLIIPLMLVSTFALVSTIAVHNAYATTPVLSLKPDLISVDCMASPSTCGYNVGAQFAYTVNVTGIGTTSGTVFAYQYQVLFNPGVLQAVNVSSFGPFFDTLIGAGFATSVTSIDNVNGVVNVAVSSLGPSTSALAHTMILGKIFFSVAGLGRSDQSLVNSILLHNAGGGVIGNIPVSTLSAVFSNTGLVGIALWPCQAPGVDDLSGCPVQTVFPEQNKWSFSGDNSFTPGCLDLFANANSTGTLPVVVKVQFTIKSVYGRQTITTPKMQLDAGQLSPVPMHTCFSPISKSGIVLVGKYHIQARLIYQQVNLDGSLTPPVVNDLTLPFKVTVVP